MSEAPKVTEPEDVKKQLSHVRAALGALLIAQFHFDQLLPDSVRKGRGKGERIDQNYQGRLAGITTILRGYETELEEVFDE